METLSESQADDKTRECYEDIKSAMGVAQVNLIWRHLAVLPNVIEFAWQTVRPHYLNNMIPNAAWLLRESITCPELHPLSEADFKVLGNEVEDLSVVDDVLRTYERGNAQNLIALCHLRIVLRQSSCRVEGVAIPVLDQRQQEREKADKVFGKLPALPEVTELTPELQLLNESLANLWVPERYRGMRPSVFRHLSHWPKCLSIIAERFLQLESSALKSLTATANDALSQAEMRANVIGGAATDLSLLSSDDRQWLEKALDVFIHGMITRGLVIVPMMRLLISNR